MKNDQISVTGKYLSSICVIVVRPLSILISEDIFAYNDLYFIVLSLFRFPLWVIYSFCCNVDLIAAIVSFVSRQVSEFCMERGR